MFIIRLFAFLFFLCFFSTNLFAENKVAYINVDLILTESVPAKSLLSQLKLIEQKEIKRLKNDEKRLKEEENKILTTKNIISKEEYIKNVNIFKEKISSYQIRKKDIIENLKKKRNNEVMRFFKLINPIIETVMEKNSIDIIIEKKNIFIAKSNYDITGDIINNIDENIKDFIIEK